MKVLLADSNLRVWGMKFLVVCILEEFMGMNTLPAFYGMKGM